jgi:hypothetical protein
MRRVVIGGFERFKVGSGSTVDDQYCIGVLAIRTGGFFRRVTIKWRTSPHIESRTHHRRGNNPSTEDREQTRTEDRREDHPGGDPGAQAPRDDPGAQAPRDDHSHSHSHSHSNCHSYSHGYVISLIIERDPRDREPRQARLAREGHSHPPVGGKVTEETRKWARRLGIGSGELAEILRNGDGFTNEHKAKIQDSRPSMPYGSRNARARTQVTTASNATSKCTITRAGTRRAAVRNSEANITAINRIVNFIVMGPVRRWRDLRRVITWYYEAYPSISRWG